MFRRRHGSRKLHAPAHHGTAVRAARWRERARPPRPPGRAPRPHLDQNHSASCAAARCATGTGPPSRRLVLVAGLEHDVPANRVAAPGLHPPETRIPRDGAARARYAAEEHPIVAARRIESWRQLVPALGEPGRGAQRAGQQGCAERRETPVGGDELRAHEPVPVRDLRVGAERVLPVLPPGRMLWEHVANAPLDEGTTRSGHAHLHARPRPRRDPRGELRGAVPITQPRVRQRARGETRGDFGASRRESDLRRARLCRT